MFVLLILLGSPENSCTVEPGDSCGMAQEVRRPGGCAAVEGESSLPHLSAPLTTVSSPPSAASFSSLDPALVVFSCLGTAVFSTLLQPVLHSWIASVVRVSEFLVCRAALARVLLLTSWKTHMVRIPERPFRR